MPPIRKTTIHYDVRERLRDVVVVRRSQVRRAGRVQTVEDIVARYQDAVSARAIANALNDARPAEAA